MLYYKVYDDAVREKERERTTGKIPLSNGYYCLSLGNITEYGKMKPSANCPGPAREKKWLFYLLGRRRGIILDRNSTSHQDSVTVE